MHEKGSVDMALKMSTHYSYRQMLDLIEMLDVYDALLEQAKNKNKTS
jgi:hypothetical protein